MKISKSELSYLGQVILTWTFINITFNMFGLLITKLLNEAEYTYLDSITNQFVKPMAIQSFVFGICLTLAYLFLKNKKTAHYVFVFVQIIVFHLILVLNLKIHHGLHFETTFSNIGLQYLSNSGQYLVDVLYLYFPIDGNFENGAFKPTQLGNFYLHWILLNILYYLALTWVAIKSVKLLFENKPTIATQTPATPTNSSEISSETES